MWRRRAGRPAQIAGARIERVTNNPGFFVPNPLKGTRQGSAGCWKLRTSGHLSFLNLSAYSCLPDCPDLLRGWDVPARSLGRPALLWMQGFRESNNRTAINAFGRILASWPWQTGLLGFSESRGELAKIYRLFLLRRFFILYGYVVKGRELWLQPKCGFHASSDD